MCAPVRPVLVLLFVVFSLSVLAVKSGSANDQEQGSSILIDTDAGFDPDDLLALALAIDVFEAGQIVGVTTTLYEPLEKALLTKLFLKRLGREDIRVHVGLGYSSRGKHVQAFYARYPGWPSKIFGPPYPRQGEPFFATLGRRAAYLPEGTINKPLAVAVGRDGVGAIIKAAHDHPGRLVVIVLGPLTNIAAALERQPGIVDQLDRLVVMGGWFEKDGRITRLSYNTIVDQAASQRVFATPGLRIDLVNSQVVKDAGLHIENFAETSPFREIPQRGAPLGRDILRDMSNWTRHSRNTMKNIVLADPATVLLAAAPQHVEKTQTVRLEMRVNQDVHMFHPDAGSLLSLHPVSPDQGAVVRVIRQISRPSCAKLTIMSSISRAVLQD